MEEKINEAIKLLNENGYIVSKISKAQIAVAENCTHDKGRCTFNMLGIKCMDLLCVQNLIKEQILPYCKDEEKTEAEN